MSTATQIPHFIGGAFVPPAAGTWLDDVEPATGRVYAQLADGNAELTKQLGLELDASGFGMGTRSKRFSMLVQDGVVKSLNVEGPGKFEVSDAGTMLKQLG